jgi:hypothetical protein
MHTLNTRSDPLADFWGHIPAPIETSTIFRIIMQNPQGIKLGIDSIETKYSMSLAHDLGAGAILFPETNLNWGLPKSHSAFTSITRSTWRHSSYITSHLQYQPGGTLTLLTDNWSARIIEKGQDPFGMGRWSYATMKGQGSVNITIVTAYRVCQQNIQSVGTTTSTAQQYRMLSRKYRDANLTADPKPLLQFIVDLQAWLAQYISRGKKIILGIDSNEDISGKQGQITPMKYHIDKPISTAGHDGSLASLMRTCGLVDAIATLHPTEKPPATYERGTQRIDYILVIGLLYVV